MRTDTGSLGSANDNSEDVQKNLPRQWQSLLKDRCAAALEV